MLAIFLIFFNFRVKIDFVYGPIVYRLGRPVFNQVRGVRLPLGLRPNEGEVVLRPAGRMCNQKKRRRPFLLFTR